MRAGCRRRAPGVSLCLELRAAPPPTIPWLHLSSPCHLGAALRSRPGQNSLLIILIATKAVLHPRSLRHLSL